MQEEVTRDMTCQECRTLATRTAVAKVSLVHSTSRLTATGWKEYFPCAFLAMCTSTGARPMKKQSPMTSHTCRAMAGCNA